MSPCGSSRSPTARTPLLGAVHPDKPEHVEPYREALDRLAARGVPAARTETLRGAIRKEL
ncbi:hypothetical protein [Streptomyces sp. NPDC091383]|uniref:hypothetical protein n=1 Tax=Streptomyces sp. NPDC091383 TaxID=3365996 RepID=UPI00129ACA6B